MIRKRTERKHLRSLQRRVAVWFLCALLLFSAVPAAAAGAEYPVINLSAQKTVQAADGSAYRLPAGAFDFILTPAPVNPAADPVKEPLKLTNRADGTVPVLINATYTQAGKYYYVLEEDFKPVPGMQYADRGYLISVTVTSTSGVLRAEVSVINENNDEVGEKGLRFLNTYDPEDITVTVPGTKVLEGGELAAGEFAFRISPVSAVVEAAPDPTEEPSPEETPGTTEEPSPQITPAPESPAARPALSTVPAAAPVPDITAAPSAALSTPSPDAPMTAEPEAAASASQEESSEPSEEAAASDEPAPTPAAPVTAEKTPEPTFAAVNGQPAATLPPAGAGAEDSADSVPADPDEVPPAVSPAEEEVTQTEELAIEDIPMPLVDTVTNTVAGTFHFGNIHFTRPGTYIYRVSEVAGSDTGIIYDPTLYTVIITVERDDSGDLTAERTIEGAESIVFRNSVNVAELMIEKDQIRNTTVPTRSLLNCAAGDTITYRLIISNPSAVTALDAVVTDKLPTGLVLQPESVSNGGTLNGDRLSWRLGSIEPGGQRIVIFNMRVPTVSTYTRWENVASVSFENNSRNAADGTRQEIPSNIVAADAYPYTASGGQTTPTANTGGTSPRTDDTTNLGLWVALFVLSAALSAAAAFMLYRNRSRRYYTR